MHWLASQLVSNIYVYMYCPKEISSARYYETQGYKEFYTEETDGISLLFPGLNTAGLSKANIPPPVDNNIASTHEFSSPRTRLFEAWLALTIG